MTLTEPATSWRCDRCNTDYYSANPDRRAQHLHECPAFNGLSVPFTLQDGTQKLIVKDREDYEGDELVQRDPNGRPVMAIEVVHEDGSNNAVVYAPTAQGESE